MAGNLNDSPAYRGRKIRGYKLGGSRPRSSSDICRGGVSIFDLDSGMIRRRGEESNPCEGRESIRDRDMIIEFRIRRFVTSLPYVSTKWYRCVFWDRERGTRVPLAEDKLQFIVRGKIFLVVFGVIGDKKKKMEKLM